MSQLLEHILNGDYASANDLFEERMVELQEKKLYEAKQMVAAEMNESLGTLKFSKADIEAKRAAGYRKATDVLGDPSAKKMKPLVKLKKKKKVSEETLDEAGPVRRFVSLYLRKQKGLGKGAMIAHQMSPEQKAEYKKAHAERRAERKAGSADAQAADLRKSHRVERPDEKERPSRLMRNVNTLIGRKPGYVAPETPDDEKGGRVGKVLRTTGKAVGKTVGFAGKVAAGVLQSAEE